MRNKRFRARVCRVDHPVRSIRMTLGPCLVFDLEPDEARELALALADVLEKLQQDAQC